MRIKHIITFQILLAILLFSSCTERKFVIASQEIQPYITPERMGLSVYFLSDDDFHLKITDPSGYLSWETETDEIVFEGQRYRGTSNISMPLGMEIPKGVWNARLVRKDGSVQEISFNVDYTSSEYREVESPQFDPATNLTYLSD